MTVKTKNQNLELPKSQFMKKIFTLGILLFSFLFFGCSKDFLKKYDKRIIGTWRITDVDRRGLGGNINNLPFREGTFIFSDGGAVTYIGTANVSYQGNWDIIKKTVNNETLRGLEISVADYIGQQVLSEYYDDMNFHGTDHFKTTIYSGGHSYITHFRR